VALTPNYALIDC